jgi:hypothetical protein
MSTVTTHVVLGSVVGTEVVVPLLYEGLDRSLLYVGLGGSIELLRAVPPNVSGLSTADGELILKAPFLLWGQLE